MAGYVVVAAEAPLLEMGISVNRLSVKFDTVVGWLDVRLLRALWSPIGSPFLALELALLAEVAVMVIGFTCEAAVLVEAEVVFLGPRFTDTALTELSESLRDVSLTAPALR